MNLVEAIKELSLLKPDTDLLFVGRLAAPTLLGLGRVTVGHKQMAEALQLDAEVLGKMFVAGIAHFHPDQGSFTVVGGSTSFKENKIDSSGLTELAQAADIRLFEIPKVSY
jgi:hypothetical protein